jgi:hypothetical protein
MGGVETMPELLLPYPLAVLIQLLPMHVKVEKQETIP